VSASIRSSCSLECVLHIAIILDARLASSKVGRTFLLAEFGSCVAVKPGAVVAASMFALSSNILKLLHGVSRKVELGGWVVSMDLLAPRMMLVPANVLTPRVVFAPI
jgi:hypothetical protein